jgi:hypothetical protein
VRELRLLERATHRSGRDTVDHPKAGHDDHANAACGAIDAVARALGLDYSAWSDQRETDPAVARMAAAIASNEKEWAWARRPARMAADVAQMIAEHDAAQAAAAAGPQPLPEEALAAWARKGQRAAP